MCRRNLSVGLFLGILTVGAAAAQAVRDIDSCKYLRIGDFTEDPYGVADELRAQARSRGFTVVSDASEVPASERYKACELQARWSAGAVSGDISVRILDAGSGSVLAEASAGGTAWWSVGRTVRSVVKKIYDQLHFTGYREEAYLSKIRRLYPPRPTVPMTEADLKARDNRTGLEGIWTDTDDQYRLGITRAPAESGADYYAVVLRSAMPVWEPGEIKAEFRATASPTVFTSSYFMGNKVRVGTTFILEHDVVLRAAATVDGKARELVLIRVWPAIGTGLRAGATESTPSSGSGFLVSHTGLVATNWHVVRGAKEIDVWFPGFAAEQRAEVVLRDTTNDLAVLRVREFASVEQVCREMPFQLAPSNRVTLGQKVQTIGYPLEPLLGTNPKFAEGAIASKTGWQDDPRSFQISTQVQPGSSGSPLIDADGNVVGIVVATLDAKWLYEAAGSLPQNVNWAIKSDYILNLLSMLPNETAAARSTQFTPEKAAKCVALIRAK